jgi:hypothetical protein
VFVLVASVLSGITAAVLDASPASLEASLPQWALVTWGATLTVGSALTLIGMAIHSLNGIITEGIGSVMVGVAAAFYATVALATVGMGAIQIVGWVIGWSIACFVRWIQLRMLIVEALRRASEQA